MGSAMNRFTYIFLTFVFLTSSVVAQNSSETNLQESSGVRFDKEGNMYTPLNSEGTVYQLFDGATHTGKRFVLQSDDTMQAAGDSVTTVTIDSLGNSTHVQGSEHSQYIVLLDDGGKAQTNLDPLKERNIKERLRNEPITVEAGSFEHSTAVASGRPYRVLDGEFDASQNGELKYKEVYNPSDEVGSHLIQDVDNAAALGTQDAGGFSESASGTEDAGGISAKKSQSANQGSVDGGQDFGGNLTQEKGTEDTSGWSTQSEPVAASKDEDAGLWDIDTSDFDQGADATVVLNEENNFGLNPGEIVGLDGVEVWNEANNWGIGQINEDELQAEISQFNREEKRRIAFEKEQERQREIARKQEQREREIARAERERERQAQKGTGILGAILQGAAIAGAVHGVNTGDAALVEQSVKLGVLGATGDAELANSVGSGSAVSSSSGGDNCPATARNQVERALGDMNSQGVCGGAGQRYVNLVKRLASSGQCGYDQSFVANAKAQCNACETACY